MPVVRRQVFYVQPGGGVRHLPGLRLLRRRVPPPGRAVPPALLQVPGHAPGAKGGPVLAASRWQGQVNQQQILNIF